MGWGEARLVIEALLPSLETSLGTLTAPALATAAVLLAEDRALPSLRIYATQDALRQYGAGGFIAAAIEHLGADWEQVQPAERDRDDLVKMLGVGRQLLRG